MFYVALQCLVIYCDVLCRLFMYCHVPVMLPLCDRSFYVLLCMLTSFWMILMYFLRLIKRRQGRSTRVWGRVSWHLCQPLHFSLGGCLAGHQYPKFTLKPPITFVHWQAVAMATALLSIGLGQTHNRSWDRMQMAAPRATISPSLVTNLRQ